MWPNTIPVLIQALIFIQIVEVEPITLLCLLVSAMIGAVLWRRDRSAIGCQENPADDGVCPARNGIFYAIGPNELDSRWRRGYWSDGLEIGSGHWRKLHSRCFYDSRDRLVCPLYGLGLCPRNVPTCSLPHHDGVLCLSDAPCLRKIHQRRCIQSEGPPFPWPFPELSQF